MATVQYIGARYVPKFYEGSNGAEWDSGVPYEPLTIVTYLGNSWTSKKPVPANIGAPNLNSDYWVLTGNYNAQIQEFINELTEIQHDINTIEQTLDSQVEAVNGIEKIIDTANSVDVPANLIGLFDAFKTQIGCLAKYGETLWTIDGASATDGTNVKNNIGCVREWDFGTGTLRNSYDITTGHANSCCYVPSSNSLYIAPTWDYSIDGRPLAYYLYKVNCSNYTVSKVLTGSVCALGLAYDYVNNKMYMMGYDYILYLFDTSNDTYSEYADFSTVGLNNIPGTSAQQQDIAIYDDLLYWTTSRNIMAKYRFDENEAELISYYNIPVRDSEDWFYMNEVEGFNFDDSGHLISAFLSVTQTDTVIVIEGSNHTYRNTANFITEFVLNNVVPYNKMSLRQREIDKTFTITNNDRTFKIGAASINSPFQFKILVQKPERLSFGADLNCNGKCPRITYSDGIIINLNGHTISNFNGFQSNHGFLTIEGRGTFEMMDNYSECFLVSRGGLIMANACILTITGLTLKNHNYINVGSLSQFIYDGAAVTADVALKVDAQERERYALYAGAKKLAVAS